MGGCIYLSVWVCCRCVVVGVKADRMRIVIVPEPSM